MHPLSDKATRQRVNRRLRESGMKACSRCHAVRALTQFGPDNRASDGRQPHCNACTADYRRANAELLAERSRRYYHANAEAIAEKKHSYYLTTAEARREYSREYYLANAETRRERHREWYQANLEYNREYAREYRQANPDYSREWAQANPDKRRANSQRRRARKAAATVEEFSPADLLAYWDSIGAYGCVACGGAYEHADHIMPLALGGEHSMANLLPLCGICNTAKGAKHPADWIAERWPNARLGAA
ncbi:HNH endonuclease [Streptomyces sp. NPDC001999]